MSWSSFGICELFFHYIDNNHHPASSNHISELSDVACFLIVHAIRYDKKVELIEAYDH